MPESTTTIPPDRAPVLSRPDFVIIGAMKCATSTLHDQLARQHGIWMSDPKEPNFFSNAEIWDRGFGWYESLFAGAPAGNLCGESSTHYTKLPTYPACADRVRASLPDAKLVYVIRDPIQRTISHYIHAWSEHEFKDGLSIDEAIHARPELVHYSKYDTQLAPYREAYGEDAILIVFNEHLRIHPQRELERVCHHIGYEGRPVWQTEQDAVNVSAQRQRRAPWLDRILRIRVLQFARRALLPEALRAHVRSRWTMQERPTLSPGSREALAAMLDPDLTRLGARLGLPLSCANWSEVVASADPPTWRTDDASMA